VPGSHRQVLWIVACTLPVADFIDSIGPPDAKANHPVADTKTGKLVQVSQ